MKLFTHFVLGLVLSTASFAQNLADIVKEGDIILHRSTSRQSQAIADATHSQFTHVGIVINRSGKPYVFEARKGVTFRSLSEFVNSGLGKRYVLKRLKGGLGTTEVAKLKIEGKRYEGKPYDIYFAWDDGEIYCSELVWKMYQRALGIVVGRTELLRDFDLTSPLVRQIMKERYGNNIPYGETVISPKAIAEAPNLETVKANWPF